VATYYSELCRAMELIGEQRRAIVIGQAVKFPGTGMSKSFEKIPPEKLIEFPVAENTQLGVSIGLSLAGFHPVLSVFPRWNFLLNACDQLVNHLDKLEVYSAYRPSVLIRVASGNPSPLDPGPQHIGEFSPAFKLLLKTVRIAQLFDPNKIVDQYGQEFSAGGSAILVEYPALYEKPAC
jgi:pyruvate/2-oxoglutarate/acetoin dehydrogenase E1 component